MRPIRSLSAAVLILLNVAAPAPAQCDWQIGPQQALPGLNIQGGQCSALYDPDGAGPLPLMLVVGGSIISEAGIAPASNIAAYDGTTWSSLGTGVSGGSGSGATVRALAVYGGQLYAAGDFTTAGGLSAARIARWNGTSWSPVGSGLNDSAYAMTVYNNELYVAGAFTTAGGAAVGRIARWNGTSWNPVSTGISGGGARINAMAVKDTFLYVGGDFTNAGGVAVSNLARWSGSTWSNPGAVNGPIQGMGAYHPISGLGVLYIAGDFSIAGGVAAANIARFTDLWSAMGPGLPGGGRKAMLVRNTTASAHEVIATCFAGSGRIMRWTGSTWNDFGPGYGSSPPEALTFYRGQYVATGFFRVHFLDTANNTWASLGPGFDGDIFDTAVLGGDLIMAGSFKYFSNQRVNGLVRWDGTAFSPMGGGVSGNVLALAVHGGSLYIGGQFTSAGSTITNSVARWNGTGWDAVGTPDAGLVAAFTEHNGELYLGGQFAGGGNVRRWTGTGWVTVGTNVSGTLRPVLELASYDGALFAGGTYMLMQTTPIARFNPATNQWVGVPITTTNSNARVNDMQEFNGSLYIGGTALGEVPNRLLSLLRLTGAGGQPQQLPDVIVNVIGIVPNVVRSMGIYQSHLHVSGTFDRAGGQVVAGFAKFDGTTWTALGGGIQVPNLNSGTEDMTVYGDELIIAGTMNAVGNRICHRWARWSCPEVCYPNCDGSTIPPVLNVSDFICFQSSYAAGDPYANCDGSTVPPVLNVSDFICFQSKYAAGCS